MNNIKEKIYNEIMSSDTIIITTHKTPDMDAIGSQLGLCLALKKRFPHKDIYAVGEDYKGRYNEYLSVPAIDIYNKALVIVTDCGSSALIADENYKLGKKIIKIDHHTAVEAYGDINYVEEQTIAACQMVYMFLEKFKIPIDREIAVLLLTGLITDSGRYLYSNTNTESYYTALKLIEAGAETQKIYNEIYTTEIEYKRYLGYVLSNFVSKNKVAFMKNYVEDVKNSGLDTFSISRGMVNAMADIEGIEIWANFTETENGIWVELRSKTIPVNTVASQFGGGGHKNASGAFAENWDVVDKIIEVLYTKTE